MKELEGELAALGAERKVPVCVGPEQDADPAAFCALWLSALPDSAAVVGDCSSSAARATTEDLWAGHGADGFAGPCASACSEDPCWPWASKSGSNKIGVGIRFP